MGLWGPFHGERTGDSRIGGHCGTRAHLGSQRYAHHQWSGGGNIDRLAYPGQWLSTFDLRRSPYAVDFLVNRGFALTVKTFAISDAL